MKKIIALFLLFLMVFSLAACTKSNTPSDDNDIVDENPQDTVEEDDDEIVEPTPSTDEVEVTLYFANKEYVETGDESLEKLIPEKRTVEYGDISLEERIVKELMKGPNSDKLSTVIPSNVKLLGVEVADGTAFVNFAEEGLYGGSMQEDFTIAQIVNSLVELDSVERVQFLIDGQKAETLMGHIEISEPFEK
ncbi:Spore germination protein-like protein [[Clostridium] ultunense Esp]|uniref:Spore germination protein-like protein n=1 Tax=[Clostridium] ultunense Esp TaxID=1288971 RepID=M1Z5C3_9FIRM|nr:GerMN domain-containing protein [Schnuerera ultunensis]CCQ93211.1 Spore germination protein-like protein [[Clostridium] ultunense Esp]SHD78124.1 Spore germination protein-like protein [[Clostridium] ultunense Esp]